MFQDLDAILRSKPPYGEILYCMDIPIYRYSPFRGWIKLPEKPEFDEETEKRRDEWAASLIN